MQALKDSLSPKAHVKRDGEWHELNARELVPGDLVSLALGCTVPADCQVLGPKQIYCDQAALTGESLPVKIDVGDKAKMGSNVTTGETASLPRVWRCIMSSAAIVRVQSSSHGVVRF